MTGGQRRLGWLVVASALALLAARGCDEDINMAKQPHYIPLQASDFFPDGASARPVVEGTFSWHGGLFSSAPLTHQVPQPPLTAELLARGQQRFNIYCSPCHGRDGYARGMVVERGYPAPPSYHEPRLRTVSDAHLERVISLGLGKMPPYGKNVPPADRWAIVAYVRALQLSQNARWNDVPASERGRLEPPVSTERSSP
jgi:mono/diheme cytochrome c family protein